MIPVAAHYVNRYIFSSYDEKYNKFSYYFLYFSAASVANISTNKNGCNPFCDETLQVQQLSLCIYLSRGIKWILISDHCCNL